MSEQQFQPQQLIGIDQPQVAQSTNQNGSQVMQAQINQLETQVTNLGILLDRRAFAIEHGLMYDGKRDLPKLLGYLEKISLDNYYAQFKRGGIAKRIVVTHPNATWSGDISISETDEPGDITPFETQAEKLFEKFNIWSLFRRADIAAALGRYSVILLGLDDITTEQDKSSSIELKDEVEKGERTLNSLHIFREANAKIEQSNLVSDHGDERFGLPKFYTLDFGGSVGSGIEVHWSRILHITSDPIDNELETNPILEAIFDLLYANMKVLHGGAEIYYRNIKGRQHLNVNDNVKFGAQAQKELQKVAEEFELGIRNTLPTQQATLDLLQLEAPEFNNNSLAILREIAATVDIPLVRLLGSQAGKLASGEQERFDWATSIQTRRRLFGVRVVRDLTDRFIEYQILPQPKQYVVDFSSLSVLTDIEKSEIALKQAQANKVQIEFGDDPILISSEIRDTIWARDQLTNKQLERFIGGQNNQGTIVAAAKLTDTEPDSETWKSIHRVVDRNLGQVESIVVDMWGGTNLNGLEQLMENGANKSEVNDFVLAAVGDSEEQSLEEIEQQILATLVDAGKEGAKVATNRGSLTELCGKTLQSTSIAGCMNCGSCAKLNFLSDISILRNLAHFTITFDELSTRAAEYASTNAAGLVTDIGLSTREALQTTIAKGIASNLSTAERVRRIKSIIGLRNDQLTALDGLRERLLLAEPGDGAVSARQFKGKSFSIPVPKKGFTVKAIDKHLERYANRLLTTRAELIDIDQTIKASNAGQRELWFQAREEGLLPAIQLRAWVDTGDDRERASHFINGQERNLDEPFELLDGTLTEPGAQIKCRCGQRLVN